MDLRKRLARLDPKTARDADTDPGAAAPPAEPPSGLGFVAADGPGGRIWVRDREICEAGLANPEPIHVLNGLFTRTAPGDLRREDIFLLDAETTGLAGGTGTLAFLLGAVWSDPDGSLRLRQYFLPSPGAESAMLADLSRLAGRFRLVVTYNGNSFDLPLLNTRGILSRIRDLLHDPVSWDLLPAARRLWGRRLPDCRQQTIEAELRGAVRGAGDIEGHLIPRAWQDFVRGAGDDRLRAVVTHNDRDMVGMVRIFEAVVERCGRFGKKDLGGPELPWQDAWSLALLAERLGDRTRQAAWLDATLRARDVAPAGETPERFWKDAIRLAKRTAADDTIEGLIADARGSAGGSGWLEREAAIFFEHRRRDPARALAHARRLDDPVRVARLEAKLNGRRGAT